MSNVRKAKRKAPKKKVQPVVGDYEDGLIRRISDCQMVVEELENSQVWRVLYNDLQSSKQLLDDNWQNIYDEKKLQETRILKMATMHVLELKGKYEDELLALNADLDKLRNKDTVITKDYDPE